MGGVEDVVGAETGAAGGGKDAWFAGPCLKGNKGRSVGKRGGRRAKASAETRLTASTEGNVDGDLLRREVLVDVA